MTNTIFIFLIAIFSSNSIFASNYPDDAPIVSDHQPNGPVLVRRDLQMRGAIALNIAYKGQLKQRDQVSVYIRFIYDNGKDVREGFFDMTKKDDGYEVRITNGCLVGQLGGCAKRATETMKHLLFWASSEGMHLNAIDFEVAFVDGNGNWDSHFGNNYKFHFGELSSSSRR